MSQSKKHLFITTTNSIATESNKSEGTGNLNEVLEKYKDRFQGIGKLKGIQVDLNVDPHFKPFAQPPHQQPFSVRQKMEEEIQHLIDQDIIEKVNEPTRWVSPPVAEHELHIDGCPVGLAATLTQRKPGEQHWRVVQYASWSRTDPEKWYS